MPVVTVTITDTDERSGHTNIIIESDPPMPIAGEDLDWEAATPAQQQAVYALRCIQDRSALASEHIAADRAQAEQILERSRQAREN